MNKFLRHCLIACFSLLLINTSYGATITGTIFEDVNYGGGAGRNLASASGVAVANVRVELYTQSTGAFLTSATTSAAGTYSLTYTGNAQVIVRVVNGTVRSTRTNGASCGATCVPVQTFETDGSTGTAVDVTNYVGGTDPTKVDAGSNTTFANFSTLTTGTTAPQSAALVKPATTSSTVTNINFGYNFDTIVSTRDSGQGSVRQFIVNANNLGSEGSLSQGSLPSGMENAIFMIPNGQANAGQNTSYTNQLTTSGSNAGAAVIALASALPTITGPNTQLDGTTQTNNVRATPGGSETNPGSVGTGGSVGVNAVSLAQFNRPEIVLTNLVAASGSGTVLKAFAVDNGAISTAGNSSIVQDTLVGMRADGTVGTVYGTTYGITAGAGTSILITHNYVKVNNSSIRGDSPGANLIVEYNEVDSPLGTPGGGHTNTFDGILIINTASNVTVRYNLTKNQRGGGIEFGFGSGAVTGVMTDNTVTTNGYNSAGVASTEDLGVAAYSLAGGTAITMSYNIITNNAGPGIVVMSSSGITITKNSFFANGGLAIDLDPNTRDPNGYGTPNGVTINDLNDADTGPNGLLNFPILNTAVILGSNLQLTGWARPGSLIELYITDSPADPSGFGEGQNYRISLTEGSASDLDTTTSSYGPAAINGLSQGTDNTNAYRFLIPLSSLPGVAVNTKLTSTATISGNTSEFSGNVIVANGSPTLTHQKTVALLNDPINGTTNPKNIPGAEVLYSLKVSNSGPGTATALVTTDPIPLNTQLFVGDLGVAGSGPIAFIDGTPVSGLSWTYTNLASTTDNVDFSNDGGTTWTYTPVPVAGYDAAVTNIRLKPAGTLNANTGAGNPSYTLQFKVKIK
ncbi:MAG: right-handed parallel beta-helix repeat-containing protein [Sulfuriferula sp.]|nr:right-handed parallel beta-helix repeat-containing protein [Sulfuriferula sp.]